MVHDDSRICALLTSVSRAIFYVTDGNRQQNSFFLFPVRFGQTTQKTPKNQKRDYAINYRQIFHSNITSLILWRHTVNVRLFCSIRSKLLLFINFSGHLYLLASSVSRKKTTTQLCVGSTQSAHSHSAETGKKYGGVCWPWDVKFKLLF